MKPTYKELETTLREVAKVLPELVETAGFGDECAQAVDRLIRTEDDAPAASSMNHLSDFDNDELLDMFELERDAEFRQELLRRMQDAAETHCRMGVACPLHDDQVHGQEASELRKQLEFFLEVDIYSIDETTIDVIGPIKAALQKILDSVDARDSLAFEENTNWEDPIATQPGESLIDNVNKTRAKDAEEVAKKLVNLSDLELRRLYAQSVLFPGTIQFTDEQRERIAKMIADIERERVDRVLESRLARFNSKEARTEEETFKLCNRKWAFEKKERSDQELLYQYMCSNSQEDVQFTCTSAACACSKSPSKPPRRSASPKSTPTGSSTTSTVAPWVSSPKRSLACSSLCWRSRPPAANPPSSASLKRSNASQTPPSARRPATSTTPRNKQESRGTATETPTRTEP